MEKQGLVRKIGLLALSVICLLTMTACASFGNNYKVNGLRLDKIHAASQQIKTDAGSKQNRSWWRKSWPYILGSVIVGVIIAVTIADHNDEKGVIVAVDGLPSRGD